MKYINFKRYKFSTVLKNLNTFIYNFLKFFKSIDFKIYNFKKIYRYLHIPRFDFKHIPRFDFKKVTKYVSQKTYNFSHIIRIDFFSSKFFLLHIPLAIIFFGFLYIFIPTFYNYDKSSIENVLCKEKNIECAVRGSVKYSFYPTPRIKINNVIINDFIKKKDVLITVEHAIIKLSFKNLLIKELHKFKKIELNEFEINLNLKNLKKYKNILSKKINLMPIIFKNGKIIFFDNKDYVATITDVNFDLIFKTDENKAELKGKFLNDNIYISFNNKKVGDEPTTDIILKMSNLNLLAKANLFNSKKDKNTINGNILIKQDKHRFTGIFSYKENKISISKSNLKNIFLDGKLEGEIRFLPHFGFDLDLSLNSINFTKLYNHFLTLDEKGQKNLFKINKKINGKLSFSSDKVYSSYNLVKAFESRIKFNNGNIIIDQFLINLGKLGAADLLGVISNDKKFTNFKYESNVFVDNQKKFLSKFGIYNKQNIPSNLFISGFFDFDNVRIGFYEISEDEKLSNDDIDFIEKEFNNYMLIDGYESLFRFPKFKEFIKSITSETN